MALPTIGTRLSFSGHNGTVRYVGGVDGTIGSWLGVEWDDPQRGKHDGVKDGVRYFSCRRANSGSFIRPTAAINCGVSFLQALQSKYVESFHGMSTEHVVLGSSHGAIQVEAVNLDKIRGKFANLTRLRQVSLDGEYVSRGEQPGEIRKACPIIRALDLSKSLIADWETIASITVELDSLQRLVLNQTRLMPCLNPLFHLDAFSHLLELGINDTAISWREMQGIISMMPKLKHVEMGYNHLDDLSSDSAQTQQPSLESLNLGTNDCRDWSNVCLTLLQYKTLDRLVLSSNQIAKIPAVDESNCYARLSSLHHLSLSHNLLSDFTDMDRLVDWCPNLQTLNIGGNAIANAYNARQIIVAKIPTLTALDSVAISSRERVDCELFYLSHYAQQNSRNTEQWLELHPQWQNLCLKHGEPEAKIKQEDNLSSRLIDIQITVVRSPPEGDQKASDLEGSKTTIRVLPNMSLRVFELKLRKQMKVPLGCSLGLWLVMADSQLAEIQGEDSYELSWWGISDQTEVVLCKMLP